MTLEDAAQEHEARLWEQNNRARVVGRQLTPADAAYGPESCSDCDDLMPPIRRSYGFSRCTECQTEIERQRSS